MKLGIKLTTPAYSVFIASLVLLVTLLLPMNIHVGNHGNGRYGGSLPVYVEKYSFKNRFAAIMLLMVPLSLHVYSINCFTVGNCVAWSWINAAIVLLWILSSLLVIFT